MSKFDIIEWKLKIVLQSNCVGRDCDKTLIGQTNRLEHNQQVII